MKIILAIFLLLATASLCWGQDATPKADRALLAIDGAAKVADFYFTTRNTVLPPTRRGEESNPLVRPFVTHGRSFAAGYFAGCWVLDALLSHELRRHGHPKLARAVVLFGIADNGIAAAMSAHGRVQ